jgi:hypothetical protein
MNRITYNPNYGVHRAHALLLEKRYNILAVPT